MTQQEIVSLLKSITLTDAEITTKLGAPHGTIYRAKSGKKDLPKKYIRPLQDLITGIGDSTNAKVRTSPPMVQKRDKPVKSVPNDTPIDDLTEIFMSTRPTVNRIAISEPVLPVIQAVKSPVIVDTTTFDMLLREFHRVIKGFPRPESVKDALNLLKASAGGSSTMNMNQYMAVVGRCDNYINGTYKMMR